jgi:hypothetical protein
MTEKKAAPKSADQFVWDTEDRTQLTSAREGHVRDNLIYMTAPLWQEMTEAWGGVVTHVKTSTDKETGEVTVAKAGAKEPGAVLVRLIGAQNTAEFSFFRPLRKLGLKVPPSRQYNVEPYSQEVVGKDDKVFTVFTFPMGNRVSVPRNKKEEAEVREPAVDQGAATVEVTAEE